MKNKISKEEFISAYEKHANYKDVAEELSISKNTISYYMKKFGIKSKKGFYSNGNGNGWSDQRKAEMSKRFSGSGNPFYGKTHSSKTKEKMSENHADFSGDKNPLRIACKDNQNLKTKLSNNKTEYWDKLSVEQRYNRNKRVIIGDLSVGFWSQLIGNAKTRNIDVNISPEFAWDLFLKQNKKCALSGVDLNLKTCYEITASIDRVDSNIGYIEKNIQWVHKKVNIAKNRLSNQDFIDMCCKVRDEFKKSNE